MGLPPYYLVIVLGDGVACADAVMMYRGGLLKVLLESFSKGTRGLPYIFIIACKVPTLEPVDGPTFVSHEVLVLGGDQWVFDGAVTFEVGQYTISTADLFDILVETLAVGYDYMTLCFYFLVVGWAPVVPWPPASSLTSPSGLDVFSTLSKAHLGYLQWIRAFLRCSISFWSSSAWLHTVLPYG